MGYYPLDAVWDNAPGSASGYDQIRKLSEDFLDRITFFNSEVINLAAAGTVVLTERVDHVDFDGKRVDARVIGCSRPSETSSWHGVTTSTWAAASSSSDVPPRGR